MVLSVVGGCATGDGPGEDGRSDPDADAPEGDGGPDAGRERCPLRCGPVAECCEDGEECAFGRCAVACEFNRCGAADERCCAEGEVCIADECVPLGEGCADFLDCDGDLEICDPVVRRCVPVPEDAACRYIPPEGEFRPELAWHYDEVDVGATPVVAQLSDDNDDGTVDASDVPDIAVPAGDGLRVDDGRLIVLAGDDGRLLWEVPGASGAGFGVDPSVPAAAGDVDGDGGVELFAVIETDGGERRLLSVGADGSIRWISTASVHGGIQAITIGDLEGDGTAEIAVGHFVFEHDGSLRFENPVGGTAFGIPIFADVDDDPELEIVQPNGVVDHDGTVLWSHAPFADAIGPVAALAHVTRTRDPDLPELVVIDAMRFAVLDPATGAVVHGPVTYEDPDSFHFIGAAGPPTVADFDGDGRAEVGTSSHFRYVVFDLDLPEPHVAWSVASRDVTTGSAASTVFDFDGNGAAEVVEVTECSVVIRRGTDGGLLWSTGNTTGTVIEYPVVADVDGDGNSELVVVGNDLVDPVGVCGPRGVVDPRNTPGVRVFHDVLDNWVPSHPIWNQHAYHISNVLADGRIPEVPEKSWTTHNTFRLNGIPGLFAPDLVVAAVEADVSLCTAALTLRARVANEGSWGVPAGVPVAFYQVPEAGGMATLLGVARTDEVLLSGDSAWVEIAVEEPMLGDDSTLTFSVRVDDTGDGTGIHSECFEDNNESMPAVVECLPPI